MSRPGIYTAGGATSPAKSFCVGGFALARLCAGGGATASYSCVMVPVAVMSSWHRTHTLLVTPSEVSVPSWDRLHIGQSIVGVSLRLMCRNSWGFK